MANDRAYPSYDDSEEFVYVRRKDMEDRFYVRLTNKEQIAVLVHDWQRNGLLKLKQDSEARGLTVKEMMLEDDTWDSFVEDCEKDGEDPESEAVGLEEGIRNAW
jgi:hypothetical protein